MKRVLALGIAGAMVAAGAVVMTPAATAAPVDASHVRFVGGPGHAGLYGWGVTTAQNGNVLLGDYWNKRIVEYTRAGAFVRTFVQNVGYGEQMHQSPYGLARDARDGSIYMADTDRRRVIKYNANGQFQFKVGVNNTTRTGPGYFQYPSRVAVHGDGRFFVADTWDNSIVAHSPTGTEVYEFATFGTGPGQVKQPHGMDFDSSNRLFVADTNNHRVQVFQVGASSASSLYSFGSQGGAPGQFAGDIRGLCIDKANNWVYVVDGQGNRVSKFTTSGTFLLRFGSTGTGNGQFSDGGRECAVDRDGNVWVGDMPNFRAQKFSPSGNFLLAVPNPPQPPPVGGFNGPRGVAVGQDGEIWVGDTYNWRFQKFNAAGSPVFAIGTRGRGDYQFNYTRMVATDPRNGDFLLTDTDNHRIKKYNRNGVIIWSIGGRGEGPQLFRNPHGIDVNAAGQIVVLDTNNDRVVILNPDGSFVRAFGGVQGGANGQFRFPRGVAWGPDNTIWVADSGRDDVQHFSQTGTYLGKLGGSNLANPFDVEVTEDYVIVADTQAHLVRVYRPNGTYVGEFGGYGTGAGKMRAPQGLDLVGDRLYVAERDNDRIQEFHLGFMGGPPPPPPPPPPGDDTTDPGVAVTTPVNNQVYASLPAGMSGTATDNVGVERVTVAIQDRVSKLWLQADGSFGPYSGRLRDAALASPGATSTAWTYAFNPGRDGLFGAQVQSWDAAGNESAKIWRRFEVDAGSPPPPPPPGDDTVSPTVSVAVPSNMQVFSGLPVSMSGSASDNVGVSGVTVAVQDRVTKLWLQSDGSWGPWTTRAQDASVAAPGAGTTTWSFSFSATGSGDYGAQVKAQDAAGNESSQVWRRFTVS